MTKNLNAGFSIIELMIVLIISGILSSIAIPNYTKLHTHALNNQIKQYAYTLQMAIETFFLDNETYPNTNNIENLLTTLESETLIKNNFINPYTKLSFQLSDATGKISYSYNSNQNTYSIKAYGKNNTNLLIQLGTDT